MTNHAGTPIGAAPCATCHAGHYQSLGVCETCHPDPQTFHHGTAVARPLTDCVGCHDGGIASAKPSHGAVACSTCHGGMAAASVPVVCNGCHFAKRFGAGTCTACHSPAGLIGREQVHTTTPGGGITCSSCHTAHNADLGSCTSCHGLVPEAHHGVAAITAAVLTLQAAPRSVQSGAAAVVSGSLADAAGSPLQGAEVLLQQRRLGDGTFSDAATLFTGADGSFSWPVQPVASTEYRVVHRGSWAGASTTVRRPAIAKATLHVTQTLTLRARPAAARAGARIRLSGVAAPTALQLGAARPAVKLRVERRSGSRWVKAASFKLKPKAGGAFSRTWRPKRSGSYRITASAASTAELLAASARVRVRVR